MGDKARTISREGAKNAKEALISAATGGKNNPFLVNFVNFCSNSFPVW